MLMKKVVLITSTYLFFFIFNCQHCLGQSNLDSLWQNWNNTELEDSIRVQSLQNFAWSKFLYSNPDSAYYYAQISYDFAKEHHLPFFMGKAILGQGVSFEMKGNSIQALEYYLKSMEVFEKGPYPTGIAGALNNIGILYYEQKNYQAALKYHTQSLELREKHNDQKGISGSLDNIADIYKKQGEFDKAMKLYEQSLKNKKDIGFKPGIASSFNYIGALKLDQEKYDEALDNFNQCINLATNIDDQLNCAIAKINIGKTYMKLNSFEDAEIHCQYGLHIAENIYNLKQQKIACECLYQIYKSENKLDSALIYLERAEQLEDSLRWDETSQKLQTMEFKKELIADSILQEEKRKVTELTHKQEVNNNNITRNILIGVGILSIIFALALWSRLSYIRKSKAELEGEKNRSDHLLLNILPSEIAQELKEHGKAEAREYKNVSILFTDFQQFTQLSEKLTPKELVSEINFCFRKFDEIIEKYSVEKIKTIGDSYMAVGGLPIQNKYSAKNTVLAALEMQKIISKRSKEKSKIGEVSFEMRIGINTGTVVAGIVGYKKFQYDIWGDAVNTASRMESYGEPGKVNISKETYELIKDDTDFEFTNRGKVLAKGKGEIQMWFVDCYQSEGTDFNINKLKQFVFNLMENELPNTLTYHNLSHTKYVLNECNNYIQRLNVNDTDAHLLRTSALLHDIGFLWTFHNHEEKSVEYAKEILPDWNYSNQDIIVISKLIMSTKIPQMPKSILENIICDSDLNYLGTDSYYEIASTLFDEFVFYNVIKDEQEWHKAQISFLQQHKYHTKFAQQQREPAKQRYLEELLQKNIT